MRSRRDALGLAENQISRPSGDHARPSTRGELARERRLPARHLHDRYAASVVVHDGMLGEGNPAAIRRDADVAKPARRPGENVPRGHLEAVFAADAPHDGQGRFRRATSRRRRHPPTDHAARSRSRGRPPAGHTPRRTLPPASSGRAPLCAKRIAGRCRAGRANGSWKDPFGSRTLRGGLRPTRRCRARPCRPV